MSEKKNGGDPPNPLPPPPDGYDPIEEEGVSTVPFALGMRITEWREGFAAVLWDVDERTENRQGVAHGGATATLLDTAAGYAAVFCPYPGRVRRAFTISLDIQYIGAIRPADGPVRCEARVTGGGRKIVFVEAAAMSAGGVLLAKAQGVFSMRSDSYSLWGAARDRSD